MVIAALIVRHPEIDYPGFVIRPAVVIFAFHRFSSGVLVRSVLASVRRTPDRRALEVFRVTIAARSYFHGIPAVETIHVKNPLLPILVPILALVRASRFMARDAIDPQHFALIATHGVMPHSL